MDDEHDLRLLLRLHLESVGYEVTEASDAIVAGHLILKNARGFDLLIADAHLPYINGIEFAAAVIADMTLPPLPIILITGHETLLDRADRLGVPCLLKPFSADTLLELVAKNVAPKPLAAQSG